MPQFFIEAPTGIGDEAKRRMMREVTAAIDHAYHIPDVRIWLREWPVNNVAAIAEAYVGLANTDQTLILMNHYPLENAWAGRLQADNPELVEGMKQLNR
jgi:hypothetical protein